MNLPDYRPSEPEQAYCAYLLQSVFFIDPNAASFRISGREAVQFLSRSGVDRLILRNIWTVADPLNEGCLLDRAQVHIILRLVSLAQWGPLVDALSIAYASGQTPIQGMIMCLEATKHRTFNFAQFEGISLPDMSTFNVMVSRQQKQQEPILDVLSGAIPSMMEPIGAPTPLQDFTDPHVSTPAPEKSPFQPQSLQLASIDDAFGGLIVVEDTPLPALPSQTAQEHVVLRNESFSAQNEGFGDFATSTSIEIPASEQVTSNVARENKLSGDSVTSFNVLQNPVHGTSVQAGQTSTIGSAATTVSHMSITEAFDVFDSVQQDPSIPSIEPKVESEVEEEGADFDEFGDFEGHNSAVERKAVDDLSLFGGDQAVVLNIANNPTFLASGSVSGTKGTSTNACGPIERAVSEPSGWDALDALAEATDFQLPTLETPVFNVTQKQSCQADDLDESFGDFADSTPMDKTSERAHEPDHKQPANTFSSSDAPCNESFERKETLNVDPPVNESEQGVFGAAPRSDSLEWDAFDSHDLMADSTMKGFDLFANIAVDDVEQGKTIDGAFDDFAERIEEIQHKPDLVALSSFELKLDERQGCNAILQADTKMQSSEEYSQAIDMEKVDSTYFSTGAGQLSTNRCDDLGGVQDAMDNHPTEHKVSLEGGVSVDDTENLPTLFSSGSLASDDPFSAFDNLSPPQSNMPPLSGLESMNTYTSNTEIHDKTTLNLVSDEDEIPVVSVDEMRPTLQESLSGDASQAVQRSSSEDVGPPLIKKPEQETENQTDDLSDFGDFKSHLPETDLSEAFVKEGINPLLKASRIVSGSVHDDFGDFAGFETNATSVQPRDANSVFPIPTADAPFVSTQMENNFGDFSSFGSPGGSGDFGGFESTIFEKLEQNSHVEFKTSERTAEHPNEAGFDNKESGVVQVEADAQWIVEKNNVAAEPVEFANCDESHQGAFGTFELRAGQIVEQNVHEEDDFGDFASFEASSTSVEVGKSSLQNSGSSVNSQKQHRITNDELIKIREKIVGLSLQLPESMRRQQGQSKGLVDFGACFDTNVGVEATLTNDLRRRIERCIEVLEHLGATGSKLGSTFWEQAVSVTRDELSMGSFLLQEATSLSTDEAVEVRQQLTVYYHGLGEFVRVCRSILGTIGDLLLLGETALCTRDTWALSWCSIGLVKDIMEVESLWKEVVDFSHVFGLPSKDDAGCPLEDLSEIRLNAKNAELSCSLCQITLQPLLESEILTKSKVESHGKEYMACAANMLGNKCSFF